MGKSLMNKKRVMIIGLDGATFDIISPMVEAGRLPTFSELMIKGTWGNLMSTVPPLTPPAWTSFMTGKNPGKHGIFGFSRKESSSNSYEMTIVNASHIDGKTLW